MPRYAIKLMDAAPFLALGAVASAHSHFERFGMEYLSQIASFIVGAISGGFAVKLYIDRSTSKPAQGKNIVGGDMAGRDINKR